ncbi:MAG: Asp23/Gls24 family envelope stress response protein [Clostridiales bacterium]|nr:Asp23/Gls24 family envelope stress response protein [Clostridiales bacterium]
MKVYGLIGKSGTGKSFQAVNLCKELNIESIIDDGLFICRNKVAAGISAKRQATKIGAVKTALFSKEEHALEVKASIKRIKPSSILVLGTSDEMVDKIVKRLEMPKIGKRVYIEEITTAEDREMAHKQRKEMGQHVIPVPTFQIKRQFSGYFMSPMRFVRELGPNIGPWRDISEKSVVRPTYSYLGEYKISEKVMADIVECVSLEMAALGEVGRVMVTPSQEGIEVLISVNLKWGKALVSAAKEFQYKVAEKIEEMTALNINRLDIEIKEIEE